MKILMLGLLFLTASLAMGQETANPSENAPAAVDQALRARVTQFYQHFIEGKFKEAYKLVAVDSQDAFFESGKQEYKACDPVKITYTENFTKATVLEICQGEFHWHTETVPTKVPVTSNWKVVDGEWYWCYVRPTFVRTPFSPTGTIPLAPDQPATNPGTFSIPKDLATEAKSILSRVKLDRNTVNLRSDIASRDEVHIRNEMPGQVSLVIDPVGLAGLKVVAAKMDLNANEDTAVVFEYKPDDTAITCGDCAKRIRTSMTALVHVMPTGQTFPITVYFSSEDRHEIALPKK